MDEDFKREMREAWAKALGIICGVLVGLGICSLLGSCASHRYVDISEDMFIHDTTYISRLRVDTVEHHDSTYIYECLKGDSVIRYEYKYKYIYKPKIEYRDSIVYRDSGKTYVATQTVEVEKSLSWWQKLRLWLGDLCLVALLIGLAVVIHKIYVRLKK